MLRAQSTEYKETSLPWPPKLSVFLKWHAFKGDKITSGVFLVPVEKSWTLQNTLQQKAWMEHRHNQALPLIWLARMRTARTEWSWTSAQVINLYPHLGETFKFILQRFLGPPLISCSLLAHTTIQFTLLAIFSPCCLVETHT